MYHPILSPGIEQSKIDCQNLLYAEWLTPCHTLINVEPLYEDCILDLCLDPSDDTATEILAEYLVGCESQKYEYQIINIFLNLRIFLKFKITFSPHFRGMYSCVTTSNKTNTSRQPSSSV